MRVLLAQPNVAVEAEPTAPVSNGEYVGRIIGVSVESSGVVATVDFLTDRHGLGNASNTLNRWTVVQTSPVREGAIIAIEGPDGGPLTVVTADQLPAQWRSQESLASTAYFIHLSAGEVYAIWPVNYPRSLPEDN